MAFQLRRSATPIVLKAARVVFRGVRSAGYATAEESQLATEHLSYDEGDEEVLFEALPAIPRRSEPLDPSRIERQEAAVTGPSSQGLGQSGDERPPDRQLSQRTSRSGMFPHGSGRRIGRCCCKRKYRYRFLGALVCVIVFAIWAHVTISVRSKPALVTPSPSPPPPWLPWRNRTDDNGLPRLLLWNPGEPEEPYSHEVITDGDHWLFETIECKVDGSLDPEVCEVTENRRRLVRSDAIVFYAEQLDPGDLPALRTASQVWVFWAKQRLPPLGNGTVDNPALYLPLLADIFNWTMSKRGDADIVLPHKTFRCPTSGDMLQAEPLDAYSDALSLPLKGDVAWILDDCELHHFESEMNISRGGKDHSTKDVDAIRIRLFPACGATLCGTPAQCVRYIAERYHFILVSLWPQCFQTVYELIYEAFKYDLVPVVLMPSRGTLKVPEKSVITSAKLQSEGQLAKYLRTVLDKPHKYRSYFVWKQNCSLAPPGTDICALCHAMWENPMPQRSHPDVLEWWKLPSWCPDGLLYGLDWAFVQER